MASAKFFFPLVTKCTQLLSVGIGGFIFFIVMSVFATAQSDIVDLSDREAFKEHLRIEVPIIPDKDWIEQKPVEEGEEPENQLSQPSLKALIDNILIDTQSGYAISGFDPISYHVDFRTRKGKDEYELMQGEIIWRFVNAGNRAIFIENQQQYIPAFAGYDAVNMSNGYLAYGSPEIWAIYGGKTYFFRSKENREKFAQNPDLALKNATMHWFENINQK